MDRLRSHTVHRLITATTLCCITHTAQCRYTWHSASLHDTATLCTDSSLLRHCAASHTRHSAVTHGTVLVYTTQPRCAPTHHCYDTVLHHTHTALCHYTWHSAGLHDTATLCTDSSLLRHCAAPYTWHSAVTQGTVPVYTKHCAASHTDGTVLHHRRGTVPLHTAQCRYTRHSVSDRTQPHCAVCTDSLAWL